MMSLLEHQLQLGCQVDTIMECVAILLLVDKKVFPSNLLAQ